MHPQIVGNLATGGVVFLILRPIRERNRQIWQKFFFSEPSILGRPLQIAGNTLFLKKILIFEENAHFCLRDTSERQISQKILIFRLMGHNKEANFAEDTHFCLRGTNKIYISQQILIFCLTGTDRRQISQKNTHFLPEGY